MMVNIPKIRGCLLSISTNFNRLSTDQSEKQEADLALPNLTDRKMDLSGSYIAHLLCRYSDIEYSCMQVIVNHDPLKSAGSTKFGSA